MDMHCPEGGAIEHNSEVWPADIHCRLSAKLRFGSSVRGAGSAASAPQPRTPLSGVFAEKWFGVLRLVFVSLDNLFKCASYQATLQCKPLSQVGVYKASAQDLEIGRRCISPRQFFASLHSGLMGVSWSCKAWSKEEI
jgi:hypothetical protein